MARIVFVDVVDARDRPLAGAVVEITLEGEPAGLLVTGDNGRATFEPPTNVKVVELKATFGKEVKHHRLTGDRWVCQLTGIHLVILVHGINTHAHWIDHIQPVLEAEELKVSAAGYGHFGVLKFLWPFDGHRRSAIEDVRVQIDAAIILHNPACISVIAHSFGTYIVARLLEQQFNWQWHHIIFCGSVVTRKFPFHQYLKRFTPPILNEIGTRDYWPALAASVTWGYGSIGSHGYRGAAVKERWHKDYRHSDFLTPDFCRKHWLPFLINGTIVPAGASAPLPWLIAILIRLPLKYIFLALLIGGLILCITEMSPKKISTSLTDQNFTTSRQHTKPPLTEIEKQSFPIGNRSFNEGIKIFPRGPSGGNLAVQWIEFELNKRFDELDLFLGIRSDGLDASCPTITPSPGIVFEIVSNPDEKLLLRLPVTLGAPVRQKLSISSADSIRIQATATQQWCADGAVGAPILWRTEYDRWGIISWIIRKFRR